MMLKETTFTRGLSHERVLELVRTAVYDVERDLEKGDAASILDAKKAIHMATIMLDGLQSRAVYAFVSSVLLDGGAVHEPITLDEAKATLTGWIMDDVELPEGLNPTSLMTCWNELIRAERKGCNA